MTRPSARPRWTSRSRRRCRCAGRGAGAGGRWTRSVGPASAAAAEAFAGGRAALGSGDVARAASELGVAMRLEPGFARRLLESLGGRGTRPRPRARAPATRCGCWAGRRRPSTRSTGPGAAARPLPVGRRRIPACSTTRRPGRMTVGPDPPVRQPRQAATDVPRRSPPRCRPPRYPREPVPHAWSPPARRGAAIPDPEPRPVRPVARHERPDTPMAELQRTLLLVKPDGVQRQLVGRVLTRFEERGLKIVGLKLVHVDRALAEQHYAVHARSRSSGASWTSSPRARSWRPPSRGRTRSRSSAR